MDQFHWFYVTYYFTIKYHHPINHHYHYYRHHFYQNQHRPDHLMNNYNHNTSHDYRTIILYHLPRPLIAFAIFHVI